jgi:hypothetical protein
MLLPEPWLSEISHHLPHHDCWHKSRAQGQDLLREKFLLECGIKIHVVTEPGSGSDFLRFHRDMMRHFAWIREEMPIDGFVLDRWPPGLPSWVRQALAEHKPVFDVNACLHGIEQRIRHKDVEGLGGFIEANVIHATLPGADVHNVLHEVLHVVDEQQHGPNVIAPMKDLGRSPGNVLFWQLHGWIDEFYARCQRALNEPVDQGPKRIEHCHITC